VVTAYPVGVGCSAIGHGVEFVAALRRCLRVCAANPVSAAARLDPLDPSEGRGILTERIPESPELAEVIAMADLDETDGCPTSAVIPSLQYETYSTRPPI